jgi:hypothetical protein
LGQDGERKNNKVRRVNVKMTLGPKGKARDVQAMGDHAKDRLGTCLCDAIGGMQFP